MIIVALLFLVSLFLLYQGLSFNNIIGLPCLMLEKFTTNNYLLMIRSVLCQYTIWIGAIGIIISIFLLICFIKVKDEEDNFYRPFWVVFAFFVLFALFTII